MKTEMNKMRKRIKSLETDMEGARVLLEQHMQLLEKIGKVVNFHQALLDKATTDGEKSLIVTPQ